LFLLRLHFFDNKIYSQKYSDNTIKKFVSRAHTFLKYWMQNIVHQKQIIFLRKYISLAEKVVQFRLRLHRTGIENLYKYFGIY